MKRKPILIGLGLVGALAVTAYAAQSTRQFVVDGNVVSSNVLQSNGRYWVPLDDVGHYFGYFVSVNASQANLTKIPAPPGAQGTAGARQPQSQNGSSGNPNSSTNPEGEAGSAQQFASGTGSDMSANNPNLPQKNQTEIKVGLNEDASVGGFDYRVTSIKPVGGSYKDTFDQRGTQLHAKFKSDSLVVVTIQETNRGDKPMSAFIPDPGVISLYDANKVGYLASDIDVRQSTNTVKKSSDVGLDLPDDTAATVMLGPGGTLEFAVIASVPGNDQIKSVVIQASGSNQNGSPASASVVVNR